MSPGKLAFKLDVPDATVTVYPWEGYWGWSFRFSDGSHGWNDNDWNPTERGAKEEAYARYRNMTGKPWKNIKRAKWIKEDS